MIEWFKHSDRWMIALVLAMVAVSVLMHMAGIV